MEFIQNMIHNLIQLFTKNKMVFIQKRLRNGDVIILPITIEEATKLIEQNEKDEKKEKEKEEYEEREKKEREKEEYEERRHLVFLQLIQLTFDGGIVTGNYYEEHKKYFDNKKHTFYGELYKNPFM